MRSEHFSRRHVLAMCCLISGLSVGAAADPEMILVAEMEPPPGIVFQPIADRSWATSLDPARLAGERALEHWVRAHWAELRSLDLEALSKFHRESMSGFELSESSEASDELLSEAIAFVDGVWHLELRGPRLPARFDIVYRYLTFFAVWNPTTSELDRVTVTIRGWVLE